MLPYPAPPLLTMTLPGKKAEVFASLLQHGILYPVEQPVALGDFLLSLPGFSQEYLEQYAIKGRARLELIDGGILIRAVEQQPAQAVTAPSAPVEASPATGGAEQQNGKPRGWLGRWGKRR